MHGGLTGLPGHYSGVMSRRLLHLSSLVTPRVHAAVFSTLWNRWCTHRRFQQRHMSNNRCVFMCGGQAEDSFEHYCRCPLVHRVSRNVLHFSYPNEVALDMWLLNSYWLDVDDNFRRAALLVYGLYRAFNTIRNNNGISSAKQAVHCIIQLCRQGALGHNECMKVIDTCWQKPISHVC